MKSFIIHNKYNKTNKTIQSISNIDAKKNTINNEILNNPTQIANVLNTYFGNIGKTLYGQIENIYNLEISTNNRYIHNTIFLRETTTQEIIMNNEYRKTKKIKQHK